MDLIGINNVNLLSKELIKYSKDIGESIEISVKESMIEVNRFIIEKSPVDTGTAVNSITISLEKAKPTKPRKRTKSRKHIADAEKQKAINRNTQIIDKSINFGSIHISSNVKYWKQIEKGTPNRTGLHVWNNALKKQSSRLIKLALKNYKKLK